MEGAGAGPSDVMESRLLKLPRPSYASFERERAGRRDRRLSMAQAAVML